MRKNRVKNYKREKDGGITFYSAHPSWLYFNGVLYEVNDKIARGFLKGEFIVKPKKKK